MTVAPYGSWPSVVTPERLVEGVVRLGEVWAAGGDLWWLESRPQEGGRQVVVRRSPEGRTVDAVPDGLSARTTLHEYGGGSYTTWGGTVFFSNAADQRLWRVAEGTVARPLTPEPPRPSAWRYADGRVTVEGGWIVCVRERHGDGGPGAVLDDLVAVPAEGGEPIALVAGRDFFAAPRPSPDGARLAWLAWDHPNMPWDATELWVADLVLDAAGGPRVAHPRLVAGGTAESLSQPRWSPDGVLHWVSDRSGWWNLYSDDGAGGRPLAPRDAEFSRPDWALGQSSYTFLPDGRLVAIWSEDGFDHLGVVDAASGSPTRVDVAFSRIHSLQPCDGGVAAVAASPTREAAVVVVAVDGTTRVLRAPGGPPLDPSTISRPRPVEFPTGGGLTAHAFHYPPANPDFEGPAGRRPPVLVTCHGGPTAAASPSFALGVQFWTSRGFAVVDVDYGGSTGYGRAYRRRLDGNWGVVDVEDCVNAALHLAREGEVDAGRMVIRGSSAGGYTTLAALTSRDEFAAGASLYGVADLESLLAHTHKFESHYLHRLVGPWPEARDRYRERSPVNRADRLSSPVILLQGLDDKVVPPAQAEVLVAALRRKGLPFAYVTFEGEQHGFRRAESIRRAAEAELWFYGRVLGFDPAGPIEPIGIENLASP